MIKSRKSTIYCRKCTAVPRKENRRITNEYI